VETSRAINDVKMPTISFIPRTLSTAQPGHNKRAKYLKTRSQLIFQPTPK
jgi:hypothetical protein